MATSARNKLKMQNDLDILSKQFSTSCAKIGQKPNGIVFASLFVLLLSLTPPKSTFRVKIVYIPRTTRLLQNTRDHDKANDNDGISSSGSGGGLRSSWQSPSSSS
jgi:hypothetical protein